MYQNVTPLLKKNTYLIVLSLSYSTLDLGCITWDLWWKHVDSLVVAGELNSCGLG